MKKIFLLSLLILPEAFGQMIPLPPAVSTVDEVVADFRKTLTTKLDELGKNFITTVSDKTIVFTNSEKIKCNGVLTPQGQPVSSMQFNYKNNPGELVEKAIYTGCNGQVSLVEDVITKGEDLKPISYADFVKGKRDFDLKDNEYSKLYRLSNSDNEELFKLLIEKKEKGKIVELYIVESKFLTMNYEYDENFTRLTFSYHGYKGKYVRKFSSWDFDRSYNPFNHVVLVKKGKVMETFYFDTRGDRLSQSDFLSGMEMFLFSGPIARIRSFLDYHNYYFPSTKVVQTGSQNEHLKEELRIAFNRLQNNTELNLVKKQIQEYMEAAENGQLIDNRPKK